ncbi:hypothetical protein H6G97_39955 [Nostoc flagelliforme FACHB-838]|uniref:Transposase n=1 Tax=Nostoc flagelliforme FACHB-838 TaxID=2692904 RepID=A0ABR8E153_9NOSO|nr:hypothetical protein [Nostoc flagelliforme]MBD2535255.1 hypothetical protein [Nostoc flagelliforme FACHB-838]
MNPKVSVTANHISVQLSEGKRVKPWNLALNYVLVALMNMAFLDHIGILFDF